MSTHSVPAASPAADGLFPGRELPWQDDTLVVGQDIESLEATNVELPASNLRARLSEQGYLLLRGFHPRDEVLGARQDITDAMRPLQVLAPDAAGESGQPRVLPMPWVDFPQTQIATWQRYMWLVQGPRILGFFSRLLGGAATTFDHKWLRIMPPGHGGANPHCDIVYMGGGTDQLFTVWTPLGDLPVEMGPLMILPQAHHHPLVREIYGRGDAHQGGYSSFSKDVRAAQRIFGTRWRTTGFAAGDILIFGMYTMHASLKNTTDRIRFSTDTRYQLQSDPIDGRHMGSNLSQLHPVQTDFLSLHGDPGRQPSVR